MTTPAPPERSFGALPPTFHPSAWRYRAPAPLETPDEFSVTPDLAADDQQQSNGCVGFSIKKAFMAQMARDWNDRTGLSGKWGWTLARQVEGTLGQNEGTYPHDALTEIRRQGICREDLFPLDQNYADLPSPQAIQDAAARAGIEFWQVPSIDDLCVGMAEKNCIGIIAIAVCDDYYYPPADGVVRQLKGDRIYGYHAIAVVGRTMSTRLLDTLGSWGENFGKRGHVYLDFSVAQARMTEAWLFKIPAQAVAPVQPQPVEPVQPVQPEPEPVKPEPEPTPQPEPPVQPTNQIDPAQIAPDLQQLLDYCYKVEEWERTHSNGPDGRADLRGWYDYFGSRYGVDLVPPAALTHPQEPPALPSKEASR